MSELHYANVEPAERPVLISHVVHTLRAYMPAIVLAWFATAILYMIIAALILVLGPSQRVTSQHFRLDFDSLVNGAYPNGTKFSTAEIVSTPILFDVFRANKLDRFTKFDDFSHSLFVLESNAEYERLTEDYQARLADPKLSTVDRDQIRKEFEAKAASIKKNDYSINYVRSANSSGIPDSILRKVLTDVLNKWADLAVREKHVVNYQVSVLSPDILRNLVPSEEDYIVRLQILRSRIVRINRNIDELSVIPSAPTVRTQKDGLSLEEIRLRLDELLRFRLEPLNFTVRASGLIKDPAATLRFLESQLDYDQRDLKSAQDRADAIRQAIAIYVNDQHRVPRDTLASAVGAGGERPKPANTNGETVMPQFNDSFIDRLVTLARESGDTEFRQTLVEQYRHETLATVAIRQAVQYDQDVLTMIRNVPVLGASAGMGAQANKELSDAESEIRQLLACINELYVIMSHNLNPSTELFTLTAPPIVHSERPLSLPKVALYGALVMLISLPLIVIACLIHARVREEEEIEGYVPEAPKQA